MIQQTFYKVCLIEIHRPMKRSHPVDLCRIDINVCFEKSLNLRCQASFDSICE